MNFARSLTAKMRSTICGRFEGSCNQGGINVGGSSKSISILTENGVEDVEFLIPYSALREAGRK